MEKFKGTKGIGIVVHEINVQTIKGRPICACGVFDSTEKSSQDINKENAKLIADAFTTINKCDLFPSELLEQRDELLDALKELHSLLEYNQGDARWYLKKHHIKAKLAIEKVLKQKQ